MAERATCATHEWLAVLQGGLDATTTLYLWSDELGDGVPLNVFSRGPFRVGYLGFPLGLTILGANAAEFGLQAVEQDFPTRLDLLHIQESPFAPSSRAPADKPELKPETSIERLGDWNVTDHEKVSRRVRRGVRGGLTIDEARPEDWQDAFALYARVIDRHSGVRRYTAQYFERLLRLAEKSDSVRAATVRAESRIVAVAIGVIHGKQAAYLHGMAERSDAARGGSEMALHALVEWAQSEGATTFNLLPSPADQPGLTAFKEKWGGTTRDHKAWTIPISGAAPLIRAGLTAQRASVRAARAVRSLLPRQ